MAHSTITSEPKTRHDVPLAKNKHLLRWVEKMADLTKPARIHWVDGSQEEYEQLCAELVDERHVHQAQRGAVAGLLLRALRRQATWPAWKTAPSSARSRKTPPAPPTTG